MRLAGAFALALLAAAGAAGTAGAQDVPQVVSPLRVETDHNNVNLVSGKTTIDGPVLSVPGAPNLRFDRVQNAAPYAKGTIGGPPGGPFEGSYSAHAGGAASESFRCPDLDCASVTGTGSTFRPSLSGRGPATYRQAGSGARYRFDVLHVSVFGSPNSQMYYYASSVTWPNGETISYSYDTAYLPDFPGRPFRRPNRVQSNLGFHITISYHPGELGTVEWNSPLQATLYADSAPTVPLQRLTYSLGGGTITDIGGRVYSCANCRNSMGAEIEVGSGSLTLPGEGAPALQVTASTQAGASPAFPIVGSVTRDGVTWNYSYGNLSYDYQSQGYWYDNLTVTGPNGFHNVYEFAKSDRRNVMTRMTDSLNRVTNFTFDAAYRPIRVVYPEGNEVSVAPDSQGNIFNRRAKARPGVPPLADIVQTAEYPDAPGGIPNMCNTLCWRPLSSVDALGRQTDYAYNADGQLTEQLDPADACGVRRRTTIIYAGGRREEVRLFGTGAACGATTELRTEYDYWGSTFLPSEERRIDGVTGQVLTTTYAYDPAGRLVSTDGPLPGSSDATYARYDAHGRRTWEIGAADGNGVRVATRTTYRPSDDKVLYAESGTIPDPNSTNLNVLRRTDFAYDGRRNPERQSVSAAGTIHALTQRTFDLSNRLECEAVRMNPALFASPPADPCVPSAEGTGADAFGPDRITRNVYDNAGQRLQHRVGVGYPAIEAAEATWEYNGNGQVRAVIDGNGNRAELRYDGHMRQDRWTFPSANGPPGTVNALDYEEYGYDAAGNRTSYRKRDGSVLSYQYDALNRMILKIVPERAGLDPSHTRDVHYGYDLRNLQLYARFDSAAGPGVVNSYDAFGRLSWTDQHDNAGTVRRLAYQYDADGNRTRITHPDGNWFGTAYDSAGRPYYLDANGAAGIDYRVYHANGTLASSNRVNTATGLAYDGVQRRTAIAHYFFGGGGAGTAMWTFGYNPASGIASESRDNDVYAWAGHYAVNRAYTANGLNQYTAAGATGFTYDANGNLISDGTRTYTYDVENRLVLASNGATLRYDPLGRLWVTSAPGFETIRYLYDGDALVAEYDAGGTQLARYVHGASAGTDDPLVWYGGASLASPRQLFADSRGSIVAVADNGGAVIAINRYDEYGIPASTNQGRFQYTGQIWLPELGMYHYKARVYSPTLGRFLQTDPIGYDDQYNLYAYVGNDPVNLADPSGTSSQCTGTRLDCGDGNGGLCMTCSGSGGLGYPVNGAPRTYAGADTGGGGGGWDMDDGNLRGNNPADRRSSERINRFANNSRGTFQQTQRGTTLTVRRNGNQISGTVSRDGRVVNFTGRFVNTPGRQEIRIEDLRWSARSVVAAVRSAPTSIRIANHSDGRIYVTTNRPFVITVGGVYTAVNEPPGRRLLNE